MFEFLAILVVAYFFYWFIGLPFYSESYRPSLGGFLKMLLAVIGLSWLFGGGDDDCDLGG